MLFEYLKRFFGPYSIFYPPYLVSGLAIGLLWLVVGRKMKVGPALKFIFGRDTWFSHSTRSDLLFSLMNLLFLQIFIKSVEFQIFSSTLLNTDKSLKWIKGNSFQLQAPEIMEAILATWTTMIFIDFATYIVHRGMHRFPLLWRFHAIHHSANSLTPFTTYRQHPIEVLVLNGVRALAAGIGLGIFHSIFSMQTPVITISGLGAGFFIYMFTVNLHHSPIPVHYPKWLRIVFISPHVHHIHHSRELKHHSSNYGVVFSFWDRLFKTYKDEEIRLNELEFGLN